MDTLTDTQWAAYERQGYLRLGKLISDDELKALQDRIDSIMLGTADVDYSRIMMQLDSDDGDYGKAGPQTKGHKGATLDYRKIQELEYDTTFLRYMQKPVFRHICERVYGVGTPISAFRAMFMNKPANKGTVLPWHQDRWSFLDQDPLITLWLAMDPSTVQNGCVQVIPGTHGQLYNPEHSSGFLRDDQARDLCPAEKAIHLELQPGEVMLLHNWLLHSSDKNHSAQSRRAFSVCYMDASTCITRTGRTFPRIFGEGSLDPETVTFAQAEG